ncbi:MarR family winged helix-turn-helix transcriptional regulator [Phaeacidiphilus oryzae]|uniref:MarR family winged helix-turn-helix transcriptional regulator n=1 Tax=Phaeacidiphilus oryzae TaxID=348818 RepID=UPI000565AB1C|nr:MarR family transcriptional regulator [Phaeacidiphilus oryzae]
MAAVERATGVDDEELITWWGLVVEAYDRTTRRVQVGPVEGVDLPGPWFEVLLRLLRTPGHQLPMTRLANEVSLTSGGFTKLADRLVGAGLVERQGCPADRRVTYVVLTPAGRRIAEEGRRRHAALLREHFLGPLGERRAAEAAGLMRALRDANSTAPTEL